MVKNIFLTENAYQEINTRLDSIELLLKMKQKGSDDVFFDNQEFLLLMNISKRLAQTWRDDEIIPYSQIGNKIYYHMSDIKALLQANYKPIVNNY